MKPKLNYSVPAKDRCQTPPYALDPLLPYLSCMGIAWEPALGEGYLATALEGEGFQVLTSDLLSGQNFLTMKPQLDYDVIVTNPPFSLKHRFVERCYELGKPFALLVPVEAIGTERIQKHMRKHGAEIMLLDRRINFKMPNAGWVDSSAQFPVLWLCWKLLPQSIVYGNIYPEAYSEGVEPRTKVSFKRMLPYQIPMFEEAMA